MAKSSEPTNRVDNLGTNSIDSDNNFADLLTDISMRETPNSTEVHSSLDVLIVDNIPVKNKFSQIKIEPSSGSSLGACEDDDYFVQISGARFGDGWDISSVTICGVEVCHILMQSSNNVIVYPSSGKPGTGDIVITSKSIGITTIENAFTYKVTVPNEQTKRSENSIIN